MGIWTRATRRYVRALWPFVAFGQRAAILSDVHTSFETNYLVPNGTFIVELLVALALFMLLVIWPLVETVVRQQWGYTLGVVLLGPIGGLLWCFTGRRETAR